ncbi:MAG: UDP-N-acetylenolpyruvoylglucosamine reductase [Spirochaetae bacterium HGW-Spirochaetae-7]|jgi:UDP-N-acetylmuramate dehydrogenase|nr:MAG: UDP-N-acetylenolpyruvoylglucosamine reductase [Spirochaetae bacterium HGW-Spirochaetae-7]
MSTLRKFIDKCNIDAEVAFDEPMAGHTTFRIGGPADAFVRPRSPQAMSSLMAAARAEGVALAVMGGGANLLVADRGVRGIVASTGLLRTTRAVPGNMLRVGAGIPVTSLVGQGLEQGLSGLEFASGLPGSTGGAVFMNARCYEHEFADVIESVEFIDPGLGDIGSTGIERSEWSYKRTPFMHGGRLAGAVIVGATFRLAPGDRPAMAARMAELEADRRAKGHFDWPSAGSLFKNDRSFGRPSGKILDELGFRGRRIGDAMVSLKHANIFVNVGAASAADMMALIVEARAAALKAYSIDLEPEVMLLGEF